jgi:DHA2 family multidrug resistance protein
VPGAVVTWLALRVIKVDLPNLSMLKRIDFSHLAAMAAFLGCLEYVLEEGPRNDWFNDTHIAVAAWVAVVAFVLFLERSFRSGGPILKLTPFRKPTFAFACVFNLVIGFGIYASTYLIPVFLGRVRGYNAMEIGTTVVVTGCAQLLSVVVAARASQSVDQRIIVTIGLSLFAFSLYLTSHLTPEWGFTHFLWPQALRGASIMLCIVPSVNFALSGFAGAELRYASGLFNLMRNLGGAVGIAVVNTWLTDNTRVHVQRFGEALGAPHSRGAEFVQALTAQLNRVTADSHQALLMAQGELAREVGRQSLTLAFNDVFRIMAWIFVVALVMVPFCRPAKTVAAVVEGH